jgi:CubicO group peptidase (beta-lactamase class C family)
MEYRATEAPPTGRTHIQPFRRGTFIPRCLATALLLGMFAGCGAATAGEDPGLGGTDLQQAWPADRGVDANTLVSLSEWLRSQNLDVHSLLVIKDDKLIFERYSKGLTRDHNYELYSITKGVTALLAGLLIDEGKISLDDKVSSILEKWRPDLAQDFADKQDIKVRHILTMSSGLQYNFKPKNDPIYYEEPDRLKLAARTHPKIAPGQEFEYTDINPILAAAVLSAAAGMPIEKYAEEKLFKPLGMKNYAWDRADGKGLVSAGWGLRLRPVDMAKVGLLVMHDGRWQNQQIVPAAWIRQMVSPGVVPYFGNYWWINDIVEGEPEYDTMGFKGQFIVVLPKRDAVVVMTSLLPIEGGLRDAENVKIMRRIMKDYVIPALDGGTGATVSASIRNTLDNELKLSAASMPIPGTEADPTDTPRR